jgi:hypothetical protein
METPLHLPGVRQHMNWKLWTPYIAIWSVFAIAVLALAIYRKILANHEDGSLHVADGTSDLVPAQIAHAHRMEVVERWGKSLTIVVGLAALVMLAIGIVQSIQNYGS